MAYVLQLAPLPGQCCASASSDPRDPIRIFDLARQSAIGAIAHPHALGRPTQLRSSPALLLACFASPSTVLGWDLRTPDHRPGSQPTIRLAGHSPTPFLALAHSDSDSHLMIAAGSAKEDESTASQIELFDLRGPSLPCCVYDQAHSDSVTALEFSPAGNTHHLLSASTDGLLAIHDTSLADQDQSILLTSNTGASLAHAQWLPADPKTIWAGSDMETLSRWDAEELSLLKDYGDLRQDSLAKPDPSWLQPVSYLISLANPSPTRSAYFAGSQSGDVALVETTDPEADRWKLLGSFNGGHSEMVRCATLHPQNGLVLTGGEDGMVCIWSNDTANQQSFRLVNRFNPSATPAIQTQNQRAAHPPHPTPDSGLINKTHSSKDNRFKPYSRH
ncbi:hypothetical protein PTTG_06732 [Puccinia triticina 1-1 BBBD Race 1]|uniref:WD_REPEATS_REGION domain-containing protein n=2 Tax=Puccinia triticina TaxID=208348 RepID=A0A180GMI8_PUCT1|nr:uncharacterized protein PtA15_2A20 [Puccinia triticina]OAV94027.1 hypothetical protein PTTG_06732 [Puccinia triticina 1-1 BBBD Race 1]WAQ81709.1 hypothetical protein PtA15_2A20 [Puccinia triticina]WAR52597.1 hypothetical protein PtB15_2B21 [Puccinia triticina]